MHEFQYEYAVIEEYNEGIAGDCYNRQWFEWNEDRKGYVEIEEPDEVRRVCSFAIG